MRPTVRSDRARAARLEAFEAERPRLMGLAYRILSSVTDAQDVLQDAWPRWDDVDLGGRGGQTGLSHHRRSPAVY